MNIDRITLSIDDKDLQNQVKIQLLEAIALNDIVNFGVENLICDAWDEKEYRMGKAFTGEQILRIHLMSRKQDDNRKESPTRALDQQGRKKLKELEEKIENHSCDFGCQRDGCLRDEWEEEIRKLTGAQP